jgi:hypothetical protein
MHMNAVQNNFEVNKWNKSNKSIHFYVLQLSVSH